MPKENFNHDKDITIVRQYLFDEADIKVEEKMQQTRLAERIAASKRH